MAYTPNYTSSDLSSIIIDLIGSGAVQVIEFIALIVIVVIVAWLYKKMKSFRR